MTQQYESRRVRMTKRLLKDALLDLMEHQDLAEMMYFLSREISQY